MKDSAAVNMPRGRIVAYPAPAGQAVQDYRVEVNGQAVDVYRAESQHHDKQYFFAYFDFCGPVEVRVTAEVSLRDVEVFPERSGVEWSVDPGGALVLAAARPFKVSVEPDGENSPLLLFGNPLEEDAPRQDQPDLLYFGPGVHTPGKISLASGQTLYLAGGAVVKAAVEARGDDIRILGRGILDGSEWGHNAGPLQFMVTLCRCRNVVIRDVILRGSWFFTIVPCGCDGVTIDNVKICGSRVGNDDGIDLVNSSAVTVRDCFLRTDDDCIAVKGLAGYDHKACEGIVVEDCCFWTDRANIFRIGYESDASAMRDMVARNIDVIHMVGNGQPPEAFWSPWVILLQPSNEMPMSGLRFENFRINATGKYNNLIRILPMLCKGWQVGTAGSWNYTQPGQHVRNCHFKDILLSGKAGGLPGRIYIAGANGEHAVDGIILENVNRFGKRTFADSADVVIGPHATNVTFL